MLRVGVIGTAGRKEDGDKLTDSIYDQMYGILISDLMNFRNADITLVSGGAAYADHLAVRAYLDSMAQDLELHFPANFLNSKYVETSDRMCPGRIANWYHQKMSQTVRVNGLIQIQKAIDKGAKTTVSSGFHQRNLLVGNVDLLIAFTFGTKSSQSAEGKSAEAGLKDGGTAHTWDNSSAPLKFHHNLHELL